MAHFARFPPIVGLAEKTKAVSFNLFGTQSVAQWKKIWDMRAHNIIAVGGLRSGR